MENYAKWGHNKIWHVKVINFNVPNFIILFLEEEFRK